jgi:hypothetical protein
MKNMSLFAFVMVGVLLLVPIMVSAGTVANNAVAIKTTFVSQDPVSAEPGGYVDLVFKFENWGTVNAENVAVELLPQYPFSLDPGVDAVQRLGTIGGLQTDDKAYLVKYHVRVDKDAINGDNEIGLKYNYGNGITVSLQNFNVSVLNPRTDFDVVVQDSSSGTTSLAIANIGSNTAYSVVVSIPDQSAYRVSGASATVLGNLDASDYTLASFQIAQLVSPSQAGGYRSGGNFTAPSVTPLKINIAYTDTLGIRRTVEKEVRLDTFSTGGLNATSTRAQFSQNGQSQLLSGGLLYIVIGVVGIVAVVAFFKLRGRKKK